MELYDKAIKIIENLMNMPVFKRDDLLYAPSWRDYDDATLLALEFVNIKFNNPFRTGIDGKYPDFASYVPEEIHQKFDSKPVITIPNNSNYTILPMDPGIITKRDLDYMNDTADIDWTKV